MKKVSAKKNQQRVAILRHRTKIEKMLGEGHTLKTVQESIPALKKVPYSTLSHNVRTLGLNPLASMIQSQTRSKMNRENGNSETQPRRETNYVASGRSGRIPKENPSNQRPPGFDKKW